MFAQNGYNNYLKYNKMKKILFVCFIALCLFTSCGIENLTTNNKGYLSIKCFQALYNSSIYSDCLARDYNYNVCYVVSYWCSCNNNDPEMFYDGKDLSGEYISVGTYTYKTKNGDTKTVQAIMRKKEFNEHYNCDKESLKRKLDIVISYTAIK